MCAFQRSLSLLQITIACHDIDTENDSNGRGREMFK